MAITGFILELDCCVWLVPTYEKEKYPANSVSAIKKNWHAPTKAWNRKPPFIIDYFLSWINFSWVNIF